MDSLRARGVNRFALLVYGGGAVLLAPWIVVLHENQATQSFGYHLKLTSLGMSLFIVVGMVVTAVTCRRATSTTLVAATSTATFLFIAAWFNTITAKNGPLAVAIVYDVLIKIPIVVVGGAHGAGQGHPRKDPPLDPGCLSHRARCVDSLVRDRSHAYSAQ
jgi:peptidoglycan/LPS O-acetylase OafA/YrhL